MLEFLWNLHQQGRINEAADAISAARTEARDTVNDVSELRSRVDALVLLNMAMWSLIEERVQISEAELTQRMRDLDLMDGKLDGRAPRMVSECRDCGRKMNLRHRACMYCGGESLHETAFAGM